MHALCVKHDLEQVQLRDAFHIVANLPDELEFLSDALEEANDVMCIDRKTYAALAAAPEYHRALGRTIVVTPATCG
ncbi:MAG: hypothetical protein ACYC9L_02855 [Sulfuricaulis sp.]